ncbi:glycosyltransferase family 2 protein [Pelagibaculum spongiae]|uniref:Glycosyl transferase family 2 n=1 Tax=Pelagibaculum spongiae TaxID=2080658 RepID=A0A2V1GXF3_9GAMM|nr:glycosyltransferase family 2 protein [Pelagibaculum spongiae]PVZ71851.1 glycosyl transferase family 2 [Pelagibaculum spongiae]
MICLIIPCYKTRDQLPEVLKQVGPEIDSIILVDDACPENSVQHAMSIIADSRIQVIQHQQNKGVGGAVCSGIKAALKLNPKVIVRIDSDGQMNPRIIPRFIAPIIEGKADFTKGNRFWSLTMLEQMPKIRLFGNAGLSFLSKLSTGYWSVMDPNNGFFAIHSHVARRLELDKLEQRYFFESDLLFRLNTIRALVIDIPMKATYQGEPSSLNPISSIGEFSRKHCRNLFKRLGYNYFLRDFNIASIWMLSGIFLTGYGIVFGIIKWIQFSISGEFASNGTVMLSALPIILGFQLLLATLQQDIASEPRIPLHKVLPENGDAP